MIQSDSVIQGAKEWNPGTPFEFRELTGQAMYIVPEQQQVARGHTTWCHPFHFLQDTLGRFSVDRCYSSKTSIFSHVFFAEKNKKVTRSQCSLSVIYDHLKEVNPVDASKLVGGFTFIGKPINPGRVYANHFWRFWGWYESRFTTWLSLCDHRWWSHTISMFSQGVIEPLTRNASKDIKGTMIRRQSNLRR